MSLEMPTCIIIMCKRGGALESINREKMSLNQSGIQRPSAQRPSAQLLGQEPHTLFTPPPSATLMQVGYNGQVLSFLAGDHVIDGGTAVWRQGRI